MTRTAQPGCYCRSCREAREEAFAKINSFERRRDADYMGIGLARIGYWLARAGQETHHRAFGQPTTELELQLIYANRASEAYALQTSRITWRDQEAIKRQTSEQIIRQAFDALTTDRPDLYYTASEIEQRRAEAAKMMGRPGAKYPLYGESPAAAAARDVAALKAQAKVNEKPSHLPTGAAERKAIPVASGVIDYFPDAIAAIAALSKIGNDQHNPGKPLFWDRTKSTDEDDTLMRHFLDRGTRDTDGVRHSTKVAWRALALLQKEIEADRG
jgi:hypothetical protein